MRGRRGEKVGVKEKKPGEMGIVQGRWEVEDVVETTRRETESGKRERKGGKTRMWRKKEGGCQRH